MNSDTIETTAVAAVKLAFKAVDSVDPSYINEKDKEPFMDGRIHIKIVETYDSIRVVNAQVKGKIIDETEHLKSEIKYSGIKICNLINYMNNGGLVFFVVLIQENANTVYYNCLTPIKIRSLLEGKLEQTTTTIRLSILPEDSVRTQEIFINFAEDCHKQTSFSNRQIIQLSDGINDRIDNLQIGFTGIGKNPIEALSHIVGHETYTYAEIEGFLIPTNEYGVIKQLLTTLSGPIVAGDKEFYNTREVSTTEHNSTIRIGKSFELVITEKTEGSFITFRITVLGTLNERILDLQFIKAVSESGGLSIDGAYLEIPEAQHWLEDSTLHPQGYLDFLIDLRDLLNKFGILEDIPIDAISNEEVNHIAWLCDGVLRKMPRLGLDYPEPSMIVRSHILDYTVLLYAARQEDGSYLIDDYCQLQLICVWSDERERYQISRFVLLESEDYGLVKNLDLNEVVDSIRALESTKGHCAHSNIMALKMVEAYDSYEKKECLIAAASIFEWLIDEEDDDEGFLIINKLQTIRRERKLKEDERQMLKLLLSQDKKRPIESRVLTAAAFILLEEFEKAQMSFDKLSPESKNNIEGYPIEKLWYSIRDE